MAMDAMGILINSDVQTLSCGDKKSFVQTWSIITCIHGSMGDGSGSDLIGRLAHTFNHDIHLP